MQLGLLDGAVDQLPVFLGIERLPDDAAGSQHRKFGHLGAQSLDGAFSFLADLFLGLGNDLIGLLPGFLLQFLPQTFTHVLGLIDHLLGFLPRFFELSLVLLLGGLPVAPGSVGCLDPFLDSGAPRLEHFHKWSPRNSRQDCKHGEEYEELSDQRPVDC
jgi:hypothetical protein